MIRVRSRFSYYYSTKSMQILLTCAECGHQEWGQSDGMLMNKIKLWNHAKREHRDHMAEVFERSLPKESWTELVHSS